MLVQTSTKPAPVKAPAFDASASAIIKAIKTADKAAERLSATISNTMNTYVDMCRVAPDMDKGEASCKAMQAAIRESQVVIDAVASGVIEAKTFTEYAQGAARALHHGVEWTPTLKNDPAMALPWGKKSAGKGGAKKAGSVETTDTAALTATLQKALKQARLLGMDGFAADLFDVASENIEGFAE